MLGRMARASTAGVVALMVLAGCSTSEPTIGGSTTCRELASTVASLLQRAIGQVDAMSPEQLTGPDGAALFDSLLQPIQQARTRANTLCGGAEQFDETLAPFLDGIEAISTTGQAMLDAVRPD